MPSAASAPGKVLLAGGYLVLDPAYTGLVFGLSARIHVVAQDVESSSISNTAGLSEIVVESPQFRDATWKYGYRFTEATGCIEVNQVPEVWDADAGSLFNVFPSEVISRNPFVETALTYTLNYVSSVAGPRTIKASRITILADSDYYSQPGKAISESSIGSRQFLDFGVRLQDAHKTGLGSSAALVSAFTGAVLSHYLSSPQFDLSSARDKALLHNLAQAAHCAAQGKVGSGFDIAAAVYGTCIYRRFSPSTLSVLGEPTSFQFAKRLRYLVEDTNPEHKWDAEIKKNDVKIPDGMVLMMCDVDCGSETVGMVKKVLGWRKQDPSGAKVLWDQLQQENEGLAKGLLSGDPRKLSESFFKIRAHIRDMGERSGVPIEPPEQTALLDAVTDSVKGVYGGVVPGAGGYDAVVLLVKDDEETLSQLHSFLKEWSSFKGSSVKLLGAKGEMEGIKKEDEEMYRVWIK